MDFIQPTILKQQKVLLLLLYQTLNGFIQMKKLLVLPLFFLAGCTSTGFIAKIADVPFDEVRVLAKKGNERAIHALCYRYSYGKGGAPKHSEKAYLWCNKSAQNDNNSGITLLAELYYLGRYVDQDYQKAFSLYEVAALADHFHAQKMLYHMYTEGEGVEKNPELAKYWIKKSASNGSRQAKRIIKALHI